MNRSMNKSQAINDSLDSNSFDSDIQHAEMWDEMYDFYLYQDDTDTYCDDHADYVDFY